MEPLTLRAQISGGCLHNEKNTAEMAGRAARKKHHWDEVLDSTRIIAAVRNVEDLQRALDSPVKIVYLLFGNPLNIRTMLQSVRDSDKLPLVNADLLQGISRDAHAVEFLANCGTAGIISTNHETLRAARAQELVTVLRTFMIDSASLESARRFSATSSPTPLSCCPQSRLRWSSIAFGKATRNCMSLPAAW